MPVHKTQQLSYRQFIFYIHMTQIGVGVLTLPRELAEVAGNSGWISLLISWVFVNLACWFIFGVMASFPDKTLYEAFQSIFGKWFGKLLSLVWAIYTGIAVGIILFTAIIILQVWILRNSMQVILVASLLIPVYMIARQRQQIQGRYAEFVFMSTAWMSLFLLYALEKAHFLNLLPIMRDGVLPVLKALKATSLPFLGFELSFFLYPFLNEKKKAMKGIVIANTMTLSLYMLVSLLAVIYFSENELKSFIWPTMQLLKSVTFPFVERFEIVFLAIYLILVSQTLVAYLYVSAVGISHVLNLKRQVFPLLVIMVACIAVSWLFEPNLKDVTNVSRWYNALAIFLGYIFPFLLWCYFSIWRYSKRGIRECGQW